MKKILLVAIVSTMATFFASAQEAATPYFSTDQLPDLI